MQMRYACFMLVTHPYPSSFLTDHSRWPSAILKPGIVKATLDVQVEHTSAFINASLLVFPRHF